MSYVFERLAKKTVKNTDIVDHIFMVGHCNKNIINNVESFQ